MLDFITCKSVIMSRQTVQVEMKLDERLELKLSMQQEFKCNKFYIMSGSFGWKFKPNIYLSTEINDLKITRAHWSDVIRFKTASY